ncbi:hypothetical protein [Leptolyngbya sp. PCC 6406]|uniref:hypothetical protein n=1 Tax=Leptolyngbya sp. PCC 6406 TaxID=1173264 RepID=UPI0002ACB8BC|nr:hypothetical protein [Leptolyngbya sp. PCC 6406]
MLCPVPHSPLASRPLVTPVLARLKRPLALLALGLGLLATGPITSSAVAQTSASPSILADGTYLYGEAPEAGQHGSTYIVMQVKNGQATGAFYMPASSFDCFHGQVRATTLTATIINSYDQTAYDYALAFSGESAIAAVGGGAPTLTLDGFHAINTLSNLDHEVLATCQAILPR